MTGLIAKISLVNFMCHGRWEMEFQKDIIFVGGSNGAGKSAILSAITLCLGGNARDTNRGTSISKFVQDGKQQAVISITIRNTGNDAYLPEEFGDRITIERKINHSGGGAFKILNAAGKAVTSSSPKTILNDIIDRFNIQVANPCAILDQDTSKSFLHNSTPKSKYEFFQKATQLETMKVYLLSIERNGSELKEKLDRKESLRPDMLKKHKKLQEELNMATDWVKKKNTLQLILKKIDWAEVAETEKSIAKIETEVDKCKETLEKADAKKTYYLKEKAMLDTNRQGVDTTIEDLSKQISAFQDDIKKLEIKRNATNKEFQKHSNTLKANESTLKALNNRKSKFEENLRGVKENQDEEIRQAQLKKDKAIASFEAKIAEKEERINQVKAELEKHTSAHESVARQAKEIEQRQNSCKREIDDIQKNLGNFTRQLQNRSLAFGPDTEVIIKTLSANFKKFEKTPIGPIGLRLSIPDAKWVKGCETCIGPLLNCYLVHSANDEKEFFAILKEKRIDTSRIRVIRQAFRTEQYQPMQLPDGSISVLSKINSDHPHILNILMDHARAERCALVENKHDAMELLDNKNPKRGHYSSVVDLTGMQYSLTSAGGIISDPSSLDRPTTLADTQSQIHKYTDRLKEKEKEMTGFKTELSKISPKAQDSQNEITKNKKLLGTLARAVDDYNDEIRGIQNEPLPADQTEAKKSWESSIEEINRDISAAIGEKKKIEELIKESRKGIEPVEEEIAEVKKKLDEKAKEVSENEAQMQKVGSYAEKLKTKQTQVQDAINNITNVLEGKNKELKQKTEEKEKKIKELEDEGKERVPLERNETPTFLNAQKNQLSKQLEEQSKNHRELTVIFPEYTASKQKLADMDDELSVYKALHKKSVDSLIKRKELYMKLVFELSKRLKMKFRQNLSHKGFQGSLIIEHTTKTLDINIVPNNKALQTDTSQLSGGERSFSTVSLLMAMWEVMENSLCAMDEFDVFMDMSSRQKSIEMLCEMAEAHKKRQFIFISPQSMQGVKSSDKIQLIVVADPKRV
jgi:chromosome segregation ATPase